jgi:rhodanese-related sulfurtransferase
MKYLIMSTILAFGLVSCTNGQQHSATVQGGEHHVISVSEFAGRPADVQLVDVRTPGEWQAGVIDGAMLCDIYSSDFEKRISELDLSKPVYVYCAVGGRSGNAASKLKKMGFKVYDLRGGMDAWKAQGQATSPCNKC